MWSAGKNIDLEINCGSGMSVTIGRQSYSRGTYSLKLANDEDLKISVSTRVPGTKIEREGDVAYHRVHYMTMYIKSSNGGTIDSYQSDDNYNLDYIYVSGQCIAPFTKFKNGDKLFLTATIKYYLKEIG